MEKSRAAPSFSNDYLVNVHKGSTTRSPHANLYVAKNVETSLWHLLVQNHEKNRNVVEKECCRVIATNMQHAPKRILILLLLSTRFRNDARFKRYEYADCYVHSREALAQLCELARSVLQSSDVPSAGVYGVAWNCTGAPWLAYRSLGAW